jgi:hypothetical protein
MSFVYEPLKMLLLFIKIPNALFSLLIAFKIKRMSKYILNHLFYMAFICWSVYIGTDCVLYAIAANSEFAYIIANMMRDLGVFMLAFTPLCFIQAGFIIKEGEEIALHTKNKRVIFTFLITFVIAVILALTDTIVVMDLTPPGTQIIEPSLLPPTGAFKVTFDSITLQGQVSTFFIFVFVAWYVASVLLMFVQQSRESGSKRKRSQLIMLGMLMIPVGICYYLLYKSLLLVFQPLTPVDLRPWFDLIGHVIWAMSPVLVFLGMRLKVLEEEKTMTVSIKADHI